ncbi:MAG TPA: ABC transporter permease [Acidobacteriota bacterium]|nr:ABC transporter permease [Acidobacteriota bacterium]
MLHSFGQDLKLAVRNLAKRPGFTVAAVVTLALGIGANTAVFTIVNSFLFHQLPVEDAGQLVIIAQQASEDVMPNNVSYPNMEDYRRLDEVFSDVAGEVTLLSQFKSGGEPERVIVTAATANYFSLLRLEAARGRIWSLEEGRRGQAGDVVLISYRFFQQRFNASPSTLGSTVELSGRPVTIIGVLPEKFWGTNSFIESDIYAPEASLTFLTADPDSIFEQRERMTFRTMARLREGVTLEQARQALAAMSTRLQERYPETNRGVRALAYPESMARLETGAVTFLPPVAMIFSVLVGLVLLIACANVANLLLARAAGRGKEIAIRTALGAGRLRIARQMVTESVLLSFLGAVAGFAIAWACTQYLENVPIASDFKFQLNFDPNLRVFAFAFLAAVVAGVLAGLLPGWQATRQDFNEALKDSGRGSSSGRQRLRSALVVTQVAVSLILLVVTGLFVRSSWNAADMDLGFARQNRLLLTTDVSLVSMDEAQGRQFYDQLLRQVRTLPGVVSATTAAFIPINISNGIDIVHIQGDEGEEAKSGHVMPRNTVNTDYFETIGTPIVQGRGFAEEDDPEGRRVAVVNQKFVETYWPGQNPLGKQVSTEGPDGPWMEIVGVARNSVYNLPGETTPPYIYTPFKQRYSSQQIVHVQTAGEPTALLGSIRGEIRRLAPDLPLFDVRTMETHLREGKGSFLFSIASTMVGSFGLIGLVLAAVGLYGVISYSVAQRRQEIGIRMALGAGNRRILSMVLRQGLLLAAIGVLLGALLAIPVAGLFANMLVDLSPLDPVTYAVVALALVAMSLLATWIPARLRALRVDPIIALRAE